MHNTFKCPKCKNAINVDQHVVFVVEKCDGVRGLLLLSAELGDYSIHHNHEIDIEEGERLEFYCPVCHGKLSVHHHPNLVRIILLEENGDEAQVFFSRIVGQNSTYLLKDGKVDSFGFESSAYKDVLM